MTALVFDTETTGMWQFKMPPDSPSQPMPIQLAASLLDDTLRNTLAQINILIDPRFNGDVFEISEGAAAVHGISQEKAQDYGVNMVNAYHLFDDLAFIADTVVAHNADFDIRIMRRLSSYIGQRDPFEGKTVHCTMRAATPILKLRKTNGRGHKWPNLTETHQHFFGCGFDGAHDAMVDVNACAAVYRSLREMGAFQ